MSSPSFPVLTVRVLGGALIAVGLSTFLIRLQHAGPYAPPEGGNLLAGLGALAVGAVFMFPAMIPGKKEWPTSAVGAVAACFAALPILFFALYATLAELEEVVVLTATTAGGASPGDGQVGRESADLRLWIIDVDGAAWVQMPRAKAVRNGLGESATAMLLRGGKRSCVVPVLFEDRESANRVHHARHEKYFVQRLATQVGLFGRDANPTTVALRLDACPDS